MTAAVDDDVPGVLAGARYAVADGAAERVTPVSGEAAPEREPARARRPKPPELSGVDLARVALGAAKEQARARGAAAQQKKQARRGGLRSGARADGRDPLPLGAAINRLITERGWETPAAVGGVMGRWPQMVGPEVAQHCEPQKYDEDARVLTVQCDSTAWATQLRLLAPQLVARLNADLGPRHRQADQGAGPRRPRTALRPAARAGQQGPGGHLRLSRARTAVITVGHGSGRVRPRSP